MATAQVARPGQGTRRRDAARPPVSKRPATNDASAGPVAKKRRLVEPYVRDSEHILRKHKGKSPSLVVHLHTNYFRFDGQEGSFAYDSAMKVMLEHIRRETVPHTILEELLALGVHFYDGCLIVEVHNHRAKEGKKEGAKGKTDDSTKFSMHNYNEHVTPSPYVPYPSKAAAADSEGNKDTDMPAPERPQSKQQEGPKITTIVLHPTEQTRHEELMILARTPASEARGKKKGSDAATPGGAQPPTPQISVPPTPGGQRGGSAQPEKMALDRNELYSFQAEAMLATEPPLYLDPVNSFGESQAVLNMLSHPLHNAKPPSPTERKKTTAEMAADDAQAAEAERRMLIMDERIKPLARTGAGVASSENQSAASSLGFSRFKTIEMVRQKHEENERQKKEEEARLAVEKRQFEEHAQQQQKQQQQQQKQQREMFQQQQQLKQRQMAAQQQAEMLRQQQISQQQQQQANMLQTHGHPGQNNMMHNNQQGNFHPQSAGSPVNRQQTQTPIMNSSPMIPQGGFPMAQNPSQGSPPMPSAAMQRPNVAMARNASQQNGSRNNTPQMQHTPSMANAMPGRQMSQTPRMQPGSPAVNLPQNTPNPNMMMQNPNQMNPNLSAEQMLMLSRQGQINAQQAAQQNNHHPQNLPQQNQGQSHAGPQDFQFAQRMAQLNQFKQNLTLQYQQSHATGDQDQAMALRQRITHVNAQMNQLRVAASNAQQQRAAMANNGGQHPNMMTPHSNQNPTPQMNHGHPSQTPTPHPQQNSMHNPPNMDPNTPHPQQQQMTQAQQQQALLRRQFQQASAQLLAIARQNGGNIPPQIVPQLPPPLQQVHANPQFRRQLAQMQMAARMGQNGGQGMGQGGMGGQGGGQGGMGQGSGGGQDQQMYMQALQGARNQMAMQMGGQMGGQNMGQMNGQMGGQNMGQMNVQNMGNMGMNGNMGGQNVGNMGQMNNMAMQQQYGNPQQGGQGNLDASFAAMANALGRQGGQGQGGGMQGAGMQ